MSRHDDSTRLRHMLSHAAEAVQMSSGRTRQDLDRDRQLNLSLVRLLEVMDESAARVSPETQQRCRSISAGRRFWLGPSRVGPASPAAPVPMTASSNNPTFREHPLMGPVQSSVLFMATAGKDPSYVAGLADGPKVTA